MHNRLRFARCYLIGPMDKDREAGRQWRKDIRPFLEEELSVICMDPYKKPLQPIHVEGFEDDKDYEKKCVAHNREDWDELSRLVKPTVKYDLRMVDHEDFSIVNLDIEQQPCGTYDEIFMGAGQKKPQIIHCPQGKENVPWWMFGRLQHQMFFSDWEQVKDYLRHIAFAPDEKIDTLNRWKFFDWGGEVDKIIALEEKKRNRDLG